MRKLHSQKVAVFFALSLFVGTVAAQDSNNESGPANIIEDIASFIGGTITEIITGTTKIASEVVKKSVGIDIFKRGYGNRRDHDPVPECVSDDAAAFTVVAAIGLQGIRLVRPTLGEAVVVTGLGLIGLTVAVLLIWVCLGRSRQS